MSRQSASFVTKCRRNLQASHELLHFLNKISYKLILLKFTLLHTLYRNYGLVVQRTPKLLFLVAPPHDDSSRLWRLDNRKSRVLFSKCYFNSPCKTPCFSCLPTQVKLTLILSFLAPPSYAECVLGGASIRDEDDNPEGLMGDTNFTPMYPVVPNYQYPTPSAPPTVQWCLISFWL